LSTYDEHFIIYDYEIKARAVLGTLNHGYSNLSSSSVYRGRRRNRGSSARECRTGDMLPLGFVLPCFSGLHFRLTLRNCLSSGLVGNSISVDLFGDTGEYPLPFICRFCGRCVGATSQRTTAACFCSRSSGEVIDTLLVTSVIDAQDQVVNQRRHGDQEHQDVKDRGAETRVVVTGTSPFGYTILEEELAAGFKHFQSQSRDQGREGVTLTRRQGVDTHIISSPFRGVAQNLRNRSKPSKSSVNILDVRVLIRTEGKATHNLSAAKVEYAVKKKTYCNSSDRFLYCLLISFSRAWGPTPRKE
jgi:hypothetical protein